MPISGGQVTPTGAGGSDFFVSADMQRAQISEGAHLIENKTGRTIDQDILIQLRDDYLEMLQRFGLDGVQGFGSAFRGFAERLKMNPVDLRAAFRTDLGEHLLEGPAPSSGGQVISDLIKGYTDLAVTFLQSGKYTLVAQAYMAVAVAASSRGSNEVEFLQQILNLANSNISKMQQYGERLLAAAPFGNDGHLLRSPAFNTLMRSGVPKDEEIESWKNLLQSGISEIMKVPEVDPYQTNAYVPLAQQQIYSLAHGFREATSGDTMLPFANSLRVLLDRGEVSLVRDFLETLNALEENRINANIYALIHIAAAQENLTPERLALIRSVLRLIRAAAPISAVKLRYYIVPLAIAYLGSSKPDAQIDKNLVILLNELLRPAGLPSEDEARDSVARFFEIDGVGDVANASNIDALVYNVFNNLVHHWNAEGSIVARFFEISGLWYFNGARIVLMSRALHQDMLHGTEEFSQRELDKYTEILFDPDPEVQRLINDARLSYNYTNESEALFRKYEEIKRRRGNGSSGSGGTSGAAPEGSPEGGAAGSGGDVEDASSVDWAEEITAAYDGYEYEIEGAEADADDWGDEQIDVADAEYYDWDIDVAPLETGGMSVYAEAFPL